MKKKFIVRTGIFASTLLWMINLNADPSFNNELEQIVIAPSCLLEKSTIPFRVLAKKEDLVLIQAKSEDLASLHTRETFLPCGKFRDVTSTWLTHKNTKTARNTDTVNASKILTKELSSLKSQSTYFTDADKYELKYQTQVEQLLTHFNAQKMWEELAKFTSFPNRFSRSQNGVDAANWLKSQSEEFSELAGRSDVTTELIQTGFPYKQPSLIVKVPGTDPKLDGILVGAHMDTEDGFMPGADDDGSGSSVTLEVMRTVFASGMKFKRTIYFAWYAAEEQGLVGSDVVAKLFKSKGIKLRGILHHEVAGYQPKPENKIYLLDDNVDPELTNFIAELAKNYAKTEVGYTRCGYACSDHASWTSQGYRAATPCETAFHDSSPYMHSYEDNLQNVSLEHMSRFAKIGIAFVGELAEP